MPASLLAILGRLRKSPATTGVGSGVDSPIRLPARTAVIAALARALSKAKRKGPVALLIFEFMDAAEVPEPDQKSERQTLRQLAKLLRSWVPEEYLVGHLREREFAVIIPGRALSVIERLADDVVAKVRTEESLQHHRGEIVTIVGVGYSSAGTCTSSHLMGLADVALRYARTTGRYWHALVDRVPATRVA